MRRPRSPHSPCRLARHAPSRYCRSHCICAKNTGTDRLHVLAARRFLRADRGGARAAAPLRHSTQMMEGGRAGRDDAPPCMRGEGEGGAPERGICVGAPTFVPGRAMHVDAGPQGSEQGAGRSEQGIMRVWKRPVNGCDEWAGPACPDGHMWTVDGPRAACYRTSNGQRYSYVCGVCYKGFDQLRPCHVPPGGVRDARWKPSLDPPAPAASGPTAPTAVAPIGQNEKPRRGRRHNRAAKHAGLEGVKPGQSACEIKMGFHNCRGQRSDEACRDAYIARLLEHFDIVMIEGATTCIITMLHGARRPKP